MSVQARLCHPLGEQWFELPPRGVDQPLVVGRAGGVDLQVPSATVAPRHCVLFVHDGRWVVQDAGSGAAGTYVNGKKLEGAKFLKVGDVVRLGTDPAAPTIEIDPAGAAQGRKGQPAAAPVSPAPPTPPPTPAEAAPPAYPPNYPVNSPGFAPVPQYAPAGPPAPAYTAESTVADWPTEATRRYFTPIRRRRSFDSGNGVIVGITATLVIAGATGYLLYRHQQGVTQVVLPGPSTGPTQGQLPPLARHNGATSRPIPDPARPTPRVAAASPAAPAPSTAPAPVPTPVPTPVPVAPDDPGTAMSDAAPVAPSDAAPPGTVPAAESPGDDPAWNQVEAARRLNDEGKAILVFDDYARTHPGTAADKIQAYTETMLDRIWFERLEMLCERRDELTKKIVELEKEIAEETDPAYKKNVAVPLREKYTSRLENIDEEVTKNMNYAGRSPPNLFDEAELDKLRRARDPQQYASWKSRVLAHIRRTHGELPWVTNKSM
jgi:hypothetical protein